MPVDHEALRHLLRRVQDGVVSRAQLIELGAQPHELERLLRRRELVTVVPGVYVDHDGTLTQAQREWVAVLACWPAALTRESALPWVTGPVVHVAVSLDRSRVGTPEGVRAHRTPHLDERVRWQRYPAFRRIVELDGRAFHDGPTARDADAARDLANLTGHGDATVRLTWGLVLTTGCRTAVLVGEWLREGGWSGRPVPCPACGAAA